VDLHITTSELGFESNADLDFVIVVEVESELSSILSCKAHHAA